MQLPGDVDTRFATLLLDQLEHQLIPGVYRHIETLYNGAVSENRKFLALPKFAPLEEHLEQVKDELETVKLSFEQFDAFKRQQIATDQLHATVVQQLDEIDNQFLTTERNEETVKHDETKGDEKTTGTHIPVESPVVQQQTDKTSLKKGKGKKGKKKDKRNKQQQQQKEASAEVEEAFVLDEQTPENMQFAVEPPIILPGLVQKHFKTLT